MRFLSVHKINKKTLRYLSTLCIVSLLAFNIGVSSFVSAPQIAYATEISTCQTLSSSGIYTLTNNITNAGEGCFLVQADSVIIDGNGYTVSNGTTYLVVDARGTGGHPNGYSVTIQNISLTDDVDASGYSYASGSTGANGGNGGSVTVSNAKMASVSSVGGTGDSGAAGLPSFSGGTAGAGGNGGTITVTNSTITANVTSSGGAGGAGGAGGSASGSGGAGSTGGVGGAGGNAGGVTASYVSITGTIYSNGGTGGVGGSGSDGNAGVDGTDDPSPGTVTNGGDGTAGGNGGAGSTGGAGGNGGSITLSNYSVGGAQYNAGSGGNGGSVGNGGSGGAGGDPSCDTEEPPNCGNQGADGSAGTAGGSGDAGSAGSAGSYSADTAGGDPVPTFSSGAINRNILTLTYDAVLLQGTSPDASDVSIDGTTNDCNGSSVSISGAVVTVTLACSVGIGETVYSLYSGTWIKDMASQNATGFSEQGVTNNTSIANLYFTSAVNNNWNTVGNWFTDVGHEAPAGYLPINTDGVYIDATVSTGPSSAITLSDLYVAQNLDADLTTANNITVSGTAYFGTSVYASNLFGTFTGNAIFEGPGANSGTVTGNATFNGDVTENLGTVTGTKTRKYTTDTTITRNFVTGGPWIVVAEGSGVDVNVVDATYNGGTTFSEVSGGNFIYELTAPTITDVSSNKPNGSYKEEEIIDIDVTFSEAVTSTGNVTVTLETGATDRTCIFTVSNATTGTCNYTVQAGDTSADLTVSTISGTIVDSSSNAMSDFIPATNLAVNKALIIDTTAPTVSITTPADTTTVSTFTPVVSWGDSTTCEYKFDSDSYASLTCGSNGSDIPTPTEGAHTLTIRGSDVATNSATAASSFTYTVAAEPTPTPTTSTNRSGSVSRNFQNAIDISPTFISEQIQSLQNIIASLRAEIQKLLNEKTIPSTPSTPLAPSVSILRFTNPLTLHDKNENVRNLQKFLNSHGFPISNTGPGSPGFETDLFGIATYNALVKFQIANGLPASGYMGPRTIEVVKKILGL